MEATGKFPDHVFLTSLRYDYTKAFTEQLEEKLKWASHQSLVMTPQ